MQSSTVSEAIEALIRARPGDVKEDVGVDRTLAVPTTKELKRQSIKRQSAYVVGGDEGRVGGARCNCGKCFICVPTPAGELLSSHWDDVIMM